MASTKKSVVTGVTQETWYLEHTDGHYKFYEIKIIKDDNPPPAAPGRTPNAFAVMYRHGRIGTTGRTGEHSRSPEHNGAAYFVTNLLNEKQAKGYVLKQHVKGALNPATVNAGAGAKSSVSKRFGRLLF